jgi:uncharacterized protein YhhL (DUF1145 family)
MDATTLILAIWAFVYIFQMLPLPDYIRHAIDIIALILILIVVFGGGVVTHQIR